MECVCYTLTSLTTAETLVDDTQVRYFSFFLFIFLLPLAPCYVLSLGLGFVFVSFRVRVRYDCQIDDDRPFFLLFFHFFPRPIRSDTNSFSLSRLSLHHATFSFSSCCIRHFHRLIVNRNEWSWPCCCPLQCVYSKK